MTSPTDEELMLRVQGGDRAAFDQLATRHLLRLRRACLRVLGDAALAEDSAQDALLRAWTRAGQYRPECGSVSAWLHRIAVNGAIDRSRSARPFTELPDSLADILADSGPDAEAQLVRAERLGVLREAVAQLPTRQRDALLLTYGEGWSGQQAADALSTSTRALEGLLRRARHMLRDYLEARDA
jgi:RNA polymerase sigma-70 factor, ECF subfamily